MREIQNIVTTVHMHVRQKKLTHRLIEFVSHTKLRRAIFGLLLLLALLAPIISAIFWTTVQYDRWLTEELYRKHRLVAQHQSELINERLSQLQSIGISLASRVQMRQLIADGKWEDAIRIFSLTRKEFPTIERILLMDLDGSIQADIVESSDITGKDFSFRDYYQGVTKHWKPYFGEVIVAQSEPYYKSVMLAVPISTDEGSRLGILLLQIKLDTFQNWLSKASDNSAVLYLVDHSGRLVAHPLYPPQEELVDYSLIPVVQEVLSGKSGINIQINPLRNNEVLVGYHPVSATGWGIVYEQSVSTAFAFRQAILKRTIVFSGVVFLMSLCVCLCIMKLISSLNRTRNQNQMILENIGEAVVAIDRFFRITHFNKAAEQISGYAAAQAIGKPFRDIIHFVRSIDHQEDISFIEQVMVYGERRTMPDNMLLVRKDGSEIYVADAAAPLFSSDGKTVIGANIIFRDVQKEKEMEYNRRDLLSMVAHEIRTPPTAIRWALSIVKKEIDALSDTAQEALQAVEDANNRMRNLGSELINVFRINFHDITVQPELIDLAELIREVYNMFTEKVEEKQLDVTTNTEGIATLNADPKIVQLILQNFISNAVKYTPDKGSICINVSKDEDKYVVLSVQDNGPGIPADEQEKLFSQFFRASNTRHIEGVGLGLCICKRLSEKCGCKLWFESREEQGTTFFFAVPAHGMQAVKGQKELA